MVPQLWKSTSSLSFSQPGKELGWALIAAFGILGVGQLYQHHMLLPESGAFRIPAEVLNQALIFSPVFFLLALRRHDLSTVWVRKDRIWLSIAIGLALALFAIRVFTLLRSGPHPWLAVTRDAYNPKNLGYAAQVRHCHCHASGAPFGRHTPGLGNSCDSGSLLYSSHSWAAALRSASAGDST
jgi:hypothetical protein